MPILLAHAHHIAQSTDRFDIITEILLVAVRAGPVQVRVCRCSPPKVKKHGIWQELVASSRKKWLHALQLIENSSRHVNLVLAESASVAKRIVGNTSTFAIHGAAASEEQHARILCILLIISVWRLDLAGQIFVRRLPGQ